MVHWNASSVNISFLTVNTRLSVAKTQEKTLSPDATQTLRVPKHVHSRATENRRVSVKKKTVHPVPVKTKASAKKKASADARLVTEKNSRANAVTSSGSKTNQNHAHHVLPQTTDARNRLPVHATCTAAANRKSREKTMNQWMNNNYRSIKQ